jgi:hypothetical protein
MSKKTAPLPVINQTFVKVPTGAKSVTTLKLGPHTVVLTAYPNRGYYLDVNGVEVKLPA